MKTGRLPFFGLLFLALLVLPSWTGADGSTGNVPLRSVGRGQEEELLRYARDVFLARLGFAGPATPPPEVQVQRACFVTFFAGKRVIACYGGFHPRTANLAREIEANVAGALRNDSRARAITRDMALHAGVQITFPGEPAPISDYRRVDPRREGLFVENDRGGVAIVPGEAKTAGWAWREAQRRLGGDPAGMRLYKFRAEFITTRGRET